MGHTYANATGVHSEAAENVLRTSKVTERMDATAMITTDDNVTFTAAQVLGGIIHRDCVGSNRTDVLPTAALMIGALRNPQVGDIVKCLIINGSDAAETITLAAGTSGDFDQIADTRIIPQNTSRMIYLRVTGVSTPTYIVYM